jgi:hypothetical protein
MSAMASSVVVDRTDDRAANGDRRPQASHTQRSAVRLGLDCRATISGDRRLVIRHPEFWSTDDS